MNDKELHRNTLIFAGIVILALILWAYLHHTVLAAMAGVQPNINQSPPVSFNIQGEPSVNGAINFPQAVYNIPSIPPDGVYSPSSCECGCSGGNAGPITFSFPDMTGLFNQLQLASNAALTNTLNNITGALPNDERVFVTNNTPTPFV